MSSGKNLAFHKNNFPKCSPNSNKSNLKYKKSGNLKRAAHLLKKSKKK